MQGTSSKRQFVHGAPCSTTLQRTFRARQHWHAFEARRLTGRLEAVVLEASALRLGDGGCDEGERGELSGEVAGGVIVIVVGSCEASIGERVICRVSLYAAYRQLIDSSIFFQVGVLIYSFVCKVKQIGQGRWDSISILLRCFQEDIVDVVGDLFVINKYTIRAQVVEWSGFFSWV